MLTGQHLTHLLTTLPTHPFTGVAYRLIPTKYVGTALSSIGSIKKGGRYNQKGDFEALYLEESPITALQEVNIIKLTDAALFSVKSSPRILLSIEITLHALLDLTDPGVQSELQTSLQELTGSWIAMNAAGEVAPTQQLGQTAYDQGAIEALRVPSAQDPRTANLVVFPDRLHEGSRLRVYDEDGLIDATLP
jgi:RES domain-containing protein